jgi:hypothetical protein
MVSIRLRKRRILALEYIPVWYSSGVLDRKYCNVLILALALLILVPGTDDGKHPARYALCTLSVTFAQNLEEPSPQSPASQQWLAPQRIIYPSVLHLRLPRLNNVGLTMISTTCCLSACFDRPSWLLNSSGIESRSNSKPRG